MARLLADSNVNAAFYNPKIKMSIYLYSDDTKLSLVIDPIHVEARYKSNLYYKNEHVNPEKAYQVDHGGMLSAI